MDIYMNTPITTNTKLLSIRDSLLELHTELLAFEKQRYEKTNGRVQSTQEFFKLVTEDENFSWLREFSNLIVSIDEMMHKKEAITAEQIHGLIHYLAVLLNVKEQINYFSQKYAIALQQSPAVAVTHGKLMEQLNKISEKLGGNNE